MYISLPWLIFLAVGVVWLLFASAEGRAEDRRREQAERDYYSNNPGA